MIYDCIVVGAGPSGLATGYWLSRMGVRFVILEKGTRAGESFWNMHDSLRLLTPASVSQLPAMPMNIPRSAFPRGKEYAEYLTEYSRHFSLPIQTGINVKEVRRDREVFQVETENGQYSTKALIVASGLFSSPYTPHIEGVEHGTMHVIHAHDYKNPASCVGKRMLIVGAGNTAAEIALELSSAGRTVALSSRKKLFAYPARVLGVEFHILARPFEVLGRIAKKYVGLTFRSRRTPIIGRDIFRAVRTGKITVVPPIQQIIENRIKFADGTVKVFDAIIVATGYRYAAAFLRGPVARDSEGVPITDHGVSSVPGLFFVGVPWMSGPDSQFLRGIASDAHLVAKRVSHFLTSLRT